MDYRKWSYPIWALIAILILAGSVIAIYVYGTYFAEPTQIPTGGTIEPTESILLVTPHIIDWETITVYSNVTKTVIFQNNSSNVYDKIVDMTFQTANWQNTTDLGLTLTWNYTGTDLYPTDSRPVTFTLTSTSPPEDPEVTHFSFDIIVTPTMQGEPA
jgi:hypothetical protein